MANTVQREQKFYIPQLIQYVENRNKFFTFLINNADHIKNEIPVYKQYVQNYRPGIYAELLVTSLEKYFASNIRFKTYDDAVQYALTTDASDQKLPWIAGLVQSCCHIKMDRKNFAPPSQYKNELVVLVSVYNETRFTELCFKSIRMSAGCECKVYAVNNSSSDVTNFKRYLIENDLVDKWLDTGVNKHADGLNVAIDQVRDSRYLAVIDADAIGIETNWLKDMFEKLKTENAAMIGPARFPDQKTVLAPTIHPSCMIIDQQLVAPKFQLNFIAMFPFFDTAGMLTWDCVLHNLPIATVSHTTADDTGVINGNIRHFWSVARVINIGDKEILAGEPVGNIRQRLERGYYLPDLDKIKNFIPEKQNHSQSLPAIVEPSNSVEAVVQPASQTSPIVSIITACYNCEDFLHETIDSILAQTYQNWELFLLDDHSKDNTRQIIESYAARDSRIKPFYFDDNKGPYVRRNFAIERAQGEYIVIQDADDIMTPQKLELLTIHMDAYPTVGALGHNYRSFIETFTDAKYTELTEFKQSHAEILEAIIRGETGIVHGSAMIRKKMFDLIGPYDKNFFGADSFWLAKLALYSKVTGEVHFASLPHVLMYRRMHANSQTGSLPTFDPRSRRRLYAKYCTSKLNLVVLQIQNNSSDNIGEQLKQIDCSDFITRSAEQIKISESKPTPHAGLHAFVCKAIEFLNDRKFVSAIHRLNGVEAINPDAPKLFKHFNLLKAMCFTVLNMKDRAAKLLATEIRDHNSAAAHKFFVDFFTNDHAQGVLAWCVANDSQFDLRIFDTTAVAPIASNPVLSPSISYEPQKAFSLVTIIMPAYNSAPTIASAITSVLNQTQPDFELIVVDDGSTDNTSEIVNSFTDPRIKLVKKENGGASSARNAGIKVAQSQYFVFMDSDDTIEPDYLRLHLEAFSSNPNADLIYCDHNLITETGDFIRQISQLEYTDRRHLIRDMFRCGYPVIQPRGMLRRTSYDKIGSFDESLLIGEDYDFMRRFIAADLKAVRLTSSLYNRRMQTNSLSSSNTPEKAVSHFTAIKRFVETFSHEELFPDIDWNLIPDQKRVPFALTLIGAAYKAIAKNYSRSNVPLNAAIALDLACQSLRQSLKTDPANLPAKNLLDQCLNDQFANSAKLNNFQAVKT